MQAALIAILLLSACSNRPSEADCRKQTDELSRFLGAMDHEGSVLNAAGVQLVARADLPKIAMPMAPVVAIDANAISYQGSMVQAPELAERLAAAQAKLKDDIERGRYPRSPPDARQIHIQIEERASWSAIVSAVTVAQDAGFTRALFTFGLPPATPPPRTKIDDKFDTVLNAEPGNRATKIAEILKGVVAPCPPLTRVFGEVASSESGDKGKFLVEAIGPAVFECRCAVDVPTIRSAMWRLLGNPNPTTAVAIELAPDAPAITQPATTTWAEASKLITPQTKTARFAIAE